MPTLHMLTSYHEILENMLIKARMGTTQYNTIVKKNCTIVLYSVQ